VVRYRDKVFRLAYKILRHEDDAAEALQDAFLSAYKGLKNFKSESTFSTWLYRVTTNAALMKYRKRREGHISLEQSQSKDDSAQPMELADWSALPPEELEDQETWDVLSEAVDQLPEDLRIVFLRRDWLEESNAEVAEGLGLTVAAVKSRLHRARIQLRDRLGRHLAGKAARRPLKRDENGSEG
jgi:RNA polymerase sigma-70 factor (ECF subfamily)